MSVWSMDRTGSWPPTAARASSALANGSNRHAECVKLLLSVSDPKALRWAAHNGHAECVRLLAPELGALTGLAETLELVINAGHAPLSPIN